MKHKESFLGFLRGKSSKRTYTFFSLGLLGIFILALVISGIIFPEQFDFRDTWISALGDPTRNPYGCIIFDVGFILTSMGLIPVFLNYYHRLQGFPKVYSLANLSLWILGTITFGFIGIFHDKIQPIHDIFAAIAYVSLSLGFFMLWLGFGIFQRNIKEKRSLLFISLSVGQVLLFWILLFLLPVRNQIDFHDFAPWEWGGTISIIVAIFLCSIFLPSAKK